MNGFYDIYIPSLKEYKAFNEITTNQEKMLSKTILAEDGPYKTEMLKCIVKILSENNVDNIDIESLTIIDCILIIIALKCYSIDRNINLNVTCNKCKSKHKVTINLINIYNKLSELNFTRRRFIVNNKRIEIGLPTIKKELFTMYNIKKYLDKENNSKEMAILNINRFITYPDTNFSIDCFDDFDLKDFEKIVEHIFRYSILASSIVAYKIDCPGQNCNLTLQRILSFDYNVMYSFLKLIFSSDLNSLYKDVYYLSKIGLHPNYTGSLTSLERTVFWSIYAEEQKNKKAKLSQNNSFNM